MGSDLEKFALEHIHGLAGATELNLLKQRVLLRAKHEKTFT